MSKLLDALKLVREAVKLTFDNRDLAGKPPGTTMPFSPGYKSEDKSEDKKKK